MEVRFAFRSGGVLIAMEAIVVDPPLTVFLPACWFVRLKRLGSFCHWYI
jgi:hypothetical protein